MLHNWMYKVDTENSGKTIFTFFFNFSNTDTERISDILDGYIYGFGSNHIFVKII